MGRSARTALVLCLSLTLTLALPIDTTTAAARLLGVKLPHDLTVSKLRKAYRKAASVSHPDVSGDEDAEAVFVKVTDAYHLLLKNIDNPGNHPTSVHGAHACWGLRAGGTPGEAEADLQEAQRSRGQ